MTAGIGDTGTVVAVLIGTVDAAEPVDLAIETVAVGKVKPVSGFHRR